MNKIALCCLLLLAACAGSPPVMHTVVRQGVIEVQVQPPVRHLALYRQDGQKLRDFERPQPQSIFVLGTQPHAPGAYALVAYTPAGEAVSPIIIPPPPTLQLFAPLGAPPISIEMGDIVEIATVGSTPIAVRLIATPQQDTAVRLQLGEAILDNPHVVAGQSIALDTTLHSHAVLRADFGDQHLQAQITRRVTNDAATDLVQIHKIQWPAKPDGTADIMAASRTISIPAPWLMALAQRLGLPMRLHDPDIPWGYTAVPISWGGSHDVTAVVSLEVRNASGELSTAFRPRRTPRIERMIRIPADGTAVAVLPIALNTAALLQQSDLPDLHAHFDVALLGQDHVAASTDIPIALQPTRSVVLIGGLLSAIVGMIGLLWAVFLAPSWLRSRTTRDLSLLASFAALRYATAVAAQLSGYLISGLLGPLGVFVSALFDEVLGISLLACLITLRPRRGMVACVTLIAGLLRGITLGTLAPADLLAMGAVMVWSELWLWVVGLTRGNGAWREQKTIARTLRFAAGFGLASLCGSLTGIALYASLFRAYYAAWYVIALALGPGLLYPILAAIFAAPVAHALRKVSP